VAPLPIPAEPTPLPAAYEMDEPEPAKKIPVALYATLGVLVLAIIGWLLFRPSTTPAPAPQTQAAAPALSPAPPPAKPTASTPSKPASSSKAAPASSSKPTASTPAATHDAGAGWRVVAYTYRSESLAQDMVNKINGKHADLHAAVFKPHSKGTAYIVTVGGAMEHDAAAKMVGKAKQEGLPQDTYMQNFSE
jgi:cytoskeletal protein RodZ